MGTSEPPSGPNWRRLSLYLIAIVKPDLAAAKADRGIPIRPPTKVPSMVKNRRLSLGIGLSNSPFSFTEANRSSMFSFGITTWSKLIVPLSTPFNPILRPQSFIVIPFKT